MLYVSCTGFLSDDKSNTRSHVLFTSRCQTRQLCTWRMTINLIEDNGCCSLWSASPGHASSHEHTTVSATEASLLRALVYGTVCHPMLASGHQLQTVHSLSDFWKHFYLGVLVDHGASWLLCLSNTLTNLLYLLNDDVT